MDVKINSMAEKKKDSLLDEINKLETAFLKQKYSVDPFLDKYPEKIVALYRDEEDFWEYRLFFEIVIYRYQQIQKIQRKPALWKCKNLEIFIYNRNVFTDFTLKKNAQLKEYLQEVEIDMEKEFIEAVGPPGVAGNAVKIMTVAEKVMALYEKMDGAFL